VPWIEAGAPKSRIAETITACAALSDPPSLKNRLRSWKGQPIETIRQDRW
jgi:hypothetical protein